MELTEFSFIAGWNEKYAANFFQVRYIFNNILKDGAYHIILAMKFT